MFSPKPMLPPGAPNGAPGPAPMPGATGPAPPSRGPVDRVPPQFAAHVQPTNLLQHELLRRMSHLTPQDAEALKAAPAALSILKKVFPEIGFVFDALMQSSGAGGSGAPALPSAGGAMPGPGGPPAMPAPGGGEAPGMPPRNTGPIMRPAAAPAPPSPSLSGGPLTQAPPPGGPGARPGLKRPQTALGRI